MERDVFRGLIDRLRYARMPRRAALTTVLASAIAVMLGHLASPPIAADRASQRRRRLAGQAKRKRCRGGKKLCGNTCVDLKTDGRNCGACGRRCSGSETCCRGACVDLASFQTDTKNCGGCGRACDSGQHCSEGACRGGGTVSSNLIANGNAEGGPASSDGRIQVVTPGWTSTTGGMNVVNYGNTSGGWPKPDDPGPPDRGLNFFTGGYHAVSVATQTVSLTSFAFDIDANRVSYDLSGYFGGYRSQGDNAKLSASLLNAADEEIAQATLGPVSVSERDSETGLLLRSTSGPVPIGTRTIKLVLTFTRSSGSSNDGYVDSLVLVLRTA